MADYDFGTLATKTPVSTPKAPAKAYDFGGMATPTSGSASVAPVSVASQIPPTLPYPGQIPPPLTQLQPSSQPQSFWDSIKGAGETALSLGTGLVAAPIAAIRGVGSNILSGKYGTQEGIQHANKVAEETANAMTYTPRTQAGQEQTGALGEFMKSAGLEALGGFGGEMNAISNASKVARPALANTARVAAEAVKDSPEAYMLGKGAKAVANAAKAVVPTVYDPELLKLAAKAKEYGIDVRPDMLSNNKIFKMMGEAMEKVPLSGAKTEARQEAFNKALIKQIGGDENATKLNSDVFANAMKKSGEEIGNIGQKYGITLDRPTKMNFVNLVEDAKKFETGDVAKILGSYVDEIESKSANGILDGTAFRKLNTKMGRQMRNTSNGDLKNALGDLQEQLHEALGKSISKDDLAAWNLARTQYAKGKTIEPLVAKATTGDISAPGLMARVTADKAGKSRMAKGAAGEMGDLAKIGQLLKEPNSSGTAERNLAYGVMGSLGGAAYFDPLSALGLYGGANIYNRLGPMMIPKPPLPKP